MMFSRFYRPKTRLLPEPGDSLRVPVLALLMFAPIVVGLVGIAMGQSVMWDLRNYHWYNAYALLSGRYARGIDFAPSQLQFFHNPLIDVPFYWLATHARTRAAFFVLGCMQGLNFSLLFMLGHAALKIANQLKKVIICAALAALGMAGGMGISEFGVPFYDNIVSLGVLGSALIVVAHLEGMTAAPWRTAAMIALIAGVPVGLATGLKMTSAVFCVGLCGGLPLSMRLNERGLLLGFFFGLGILAGAAATYGYWGVYLYSHFDSPMFPYFNRIFHSPYVAPGYIEDFSAPRGLLAPLLYPFLFTIKPTLVNEIPFRDFRIPILYVLMIALGVRHLLPGMKKPAVDPVTDYLLCAASLGYLVWISVEAFYRYLLPLEMLAPLLIVICAMRLPVSPRLQAATAMGLFLAVVFSIKPAQWERRHEWSEKIAQVERPALPDDGQTMILMAGNDGYAYMIPEFPPSVSFVRMESRAFQLDAGWGVNDLVRARIDAHKGPLKLLIPARGLKDAQDRPLKFFGLKTVAGSCKDVTDDIPENDTDPLYPKFYKLCDVVHK